MAKEHRLKQLEQKINPDPGLVYVLIDNQGKRWANGKEYSAAEFTRQYQGANITAVRVGFDIGRL